VYATQFHPELDTASFTSRVRAYADHGYFHPTEVDAIIERVERADVRASHMVLGRFVEEYLDSRPAAAAADGAVRDAAARTGSAGSRSADAARPASATTTAA
jgi:GMP synthase (glutamine-hydrolysing)